MFGLQESIYHNVPVVVIPIFSDQFDNARRVEEKAFGQVIWNKFNITRDIVQNKIKAVMSDERYGQ